MKAWRWIALSLLAAAAIPAGLARAQEQPMDVDTQRSAIRQLAFDPARFFPDHTAKPLIAIRYTGDDYGYPVYSLAVRRGCTAQDQGEARKTCFNRLTARMVRVPGIGPKEGEGRGRRIAGAKVFARIHELAPRNEAELRMGVAGLGLEWLEADVGACPAALAHLETAPALSFFAHPALPEDNSLAIVLHADKIDFAYGEYLTRSRYVGYAKPGSAGAWANEFAASLADCWKPATATAPWFLDKPLEPEIAPAF